jgi:hypothetical protein
MHAMLENTVENYFLGALLVLPSHYSECLQLIQNETLFKEHGKVIPGHIRCE